MAKNIGYEEYLRMIMDQGKQVRTGTTTPSQLPYYKYLEQGVTQSEKQMIPEITKQAMAQGYTGGGLNEMYRKAMETGITGRLGAEKQAWEGTGAEGMEAAKTAGGIDTQQQKILMDAIMQKKAIDAQKAASSWGSNYGTTCCFIMLETDDLTDNVRILRDEWFPPDSYVAKGYKRMASWLVPKMRENYLVKRFVKLVMTHPISKCAEHYGKVRALLYAPIGMFWTGVWYGLGKV
jgi:hypothetical protein